MGPLTESMTRLTGEIVAFRGERKHFVKVLGHDVFTMLAQFHHAHAQMAHQTRKERQAFVRTLERDVAGMQAGFRHAHALMARKTRAERRAAVNHLKKTVGTLRREFALDLAGAHRAWCGPNPAELRAKAEAERRAKAEAEHVKVAAERDRMAALAMAKEEAIRHHAAPPAKPKVGRQPKKKKKNP
jgi:hypothetical protein